ncbi:hypothetical protein HYR69_09910 [Candidatus Sumerlaeota bacterium]|nr:hypothetical protein [Candidatus Sumerlaeota bacterium]
MADAEELKKLDMELRDALQRQDFTEALDILDELESKGGMKAPHLAARGQCLLKLRRKQDAKTVLMQAFELDPTFQPTCQLLDENFPGWTRQQRPKPSPPPPMSPAPPRQAPAGYAPQAPQSQPYYQAAPSAPAQMYQQRTPSSPSMPGYGQMQAGYAPYVPAQAAGSQDPPVNWRYVMEDLELAMRESGSRMAHIPASASSEPVSL